MAIFENTSQYANKLALFFKIKLPPNYSLTNHVYIYFTECKQMIDVELTC